LDEILKLLKLFQIIWSS